MMRDIPFDDGWRFSRGGGDAFEAPGLDDSAWREVRLSHDWSIEDVPGGKAPDQAGPFDRLAIGANATGFTVGGEGWYRKHFRLADHPDDSIVEILFGGAYLHTEVWLNGRRLGESVSGYIPFAFDLTPFLIRHGDNVLAVRVRNEGRNTRWYAGSGLYRSVTLDVLPSRCRVQRWGVAAWTSALESGAATVDVRTELQGALDGCELTTRLRDRDGSIVASATASADASVPQSLVLRGPRLWSPDAPNLYTLETVLSRGGQPLDHVEQPFGIRIIAFDPQRGMTINGTSTKLRGACLHHDNGLLGACAFADADDRRVRLLKARGFNAIRSSHNPSSRTLRDACDRLGMLLIEEAFDTWHEGKEPQDFATEFRGHWADVIRGMVLPARNSPSVMMWSIGNEIPSRTTDEGLEWSWTLANAVKRLDHTRPVTAGLNGVLGQEVRVKPQTLAGRTKAVVDNASTVFLDIPGYNYRFDDIEGEHLQHPDRVVYASETFARDVFDYAELVKKAPYFLGEFVWTAMDYIGEAGIGATARIKKSDPPYYLARWPWVNAWCGDLDLIGCQKPASLARDVAWGVSKLEITVAQPLAGDEVAWVANWGWPDELQSWTWPGHEGKSLNVRVYTSAQRVRLIADGATVMDRKLRPADKMCLTVPLPYRSGRLEAVAYDGDREIARRRLETVGPATRVRVSEQKGDRQRHGALLIFLLIEIVDDEDRLVLDGRTLDLEVHGPLEIAGFGSADPMATGSLHSKTTASFRGRAMAILRVNGRGGASVGVHSPGLVSARTSFGGDLR